MDYIDMLVEYKGGGFNGNFWQWNYFYFDSEGEFHNLYSMGHKGIADRNGAIEFMATVEKCYAAMPFRGINEFDPERVKLQRFWEKHNPTVINPVSGTIEEMLDFVAGGNASNMIYIAHKLAELEIMLIGQCYECETIAPVIELVASNYSGDGGVAYSAKDLVCDKCNGLSELY